MIKKKWLLLAEDNVNDADLAMHALEFDEAPVEVVIAHDGTEVLDCLRHHGEFVHSNRGNPAVVLLDLHMPRVNGFQVLEEIKADAQLKYIPIVVFTSSLEPRDVVRCYQLGANAYVSKPVDFRPYIAALKEITVFWTTLNEPPPDTMPHEHDEPVQEHHHWA